MKIVVLAGGNSTERDVSLSSGTKAYRALKEKGQQAILLDVYLGIEDIDVTTAFEDDRDWAAGFGTIGEVNPDLEEVRALKKDEGFFGSHVIELCQMADIVFMALHGANGEDGRIQAAFDLFNIKYTGTDYLSSAICMDKAVTKDFLQFNHILTPKSAVVYQGEDYREVANSIGYPLVVKTCCGGSSVGVYMVNCEEELNAAVTQAYRFENVLLIEQYIKGREFTCGVIEGRALPVVEIAPVEGFYDYKNKYQAGMTVETCPAKISEELTSKIQEAAEHTFRALRLKTYARIDFIMSMDGKPYCLEANTLPGMTPTSLLPQEAAVEGMDYASLCEHIVEISLRKYSD